MIVAILVLSAQSVANADWTIINPMDTVEPSDSIPASGEGPSFEPKSILLFKWDGSSYGSYGSATPSTVEADQSGYWNSTLYPEVNTFLVGDYQLDIDWPTS